MRVLVACEYSGRVRDAFRARGHDAWSCDHLPSDADPRWHIQGDVLAILDEGWDMMIAHPPCTYLCNSGAKHMYIGMKKENGPCPERMRNVEASATFFKALLDADIPRKAIENPVMHGTGKALIGVEQSQIIQPWQFGHKEMKATCLWLDGLPLLQPSDVVGPPPVCTEERKSWAVVHRMPPGPDRWKLRSTTYPGIAEAMADQWGNSAGCRVLPSIIVPDCHMEKSDNA